MIHKRILNSLPWPSNLKRTCHLLLLLVIVLLDVSTGIENNVLSIPRVKVDKTVVKGAKGEDVVDAVLMKLEHSRIFPKDNNMMKRIALVESRFGQHPSTYRSGYHGGIWQVDRIGFEDTLNIKSHPALKKKHEEIKKYFGLDWATMTWEELEKPQNSALAARLLLATKPEKIPDQLEKQGEYYKKYYNSEHENAKGSAGKFVEDVQAFEKKKNKAGGGNTGDGGQDINKGRGKVNLVVVLDSSGSITSQGFESAKEAVANLMSGYSLENSRLALISYSSGASVIFPLSTKFSSVEELRNAVKSTPYTAQGTRTDLGVDAAVAMFQGASTNDNGNIPKAMAVFTDGATERRDLLEMSMERARQAGINSFATGIGPSVNQQELLSIAADEEKNVWDFSSFDAWKESSTWINSAIQSVHQEPEIDVPVSDILMQEESRYYKYSIPTEGLTVKIDNVEGKTRGFYSFSVETPNSALYDGVLEKPHTFIPNPSSTQAHPQNPSQSQRRRKRSIENPPFTNTTFPLYLSIVGLETENNYTISAVDGNQVPEEDGGNAWIWIGLVLSFLVVTAGGLGFAKLRTKKPKSENPDPSKTKTSGGRENVPFL